MSNRRAILVLLLGIVLLVFAHVGVRSYDPVRKTERRRTLFGQTEDIRGLKIERRGASALEIRRDETMAWRIVEPFTGRADDQAISRLLDVLVLTPVIDIVSDDELLRLGRTHADFSLAEPLVKVSLETEQGVETVSFGVRTPSGDGVYVITDGVPAVFVVPTEVFTSVDRPTESFRRRRLFSMTPESVSSFVVRQGKGATLSFARENDGWKVDGELASKSCVEGFLVELLSAEAQDFVWPVGASNEMERVSEALLAGYDLETESAVTVTLKGTDDAGCQVSLGSAATQGRVYASVQNGSAVVTVKESLKTAALQTKAVFADFRLFPVSESSVGIIRLLDGECSYVLTRSPEGIWRMETPVSAVADPTVVRRILSRILFLPTAAAQNVSRGFSVALSAEAEPINVPRNLVLEGGRLDELRSLEMVRIDPKEVKRLVSASGEKNGSSLSVVRGREDGSWALESASDRQAVNPKALAAILEALSPLMAIRVEKLKVSAADLDGYGLGTPFLTVAVDLDRENAVRRNILVGGKTKGGRYATVGSADAVFVISEKTVERLSKKPVEE